MIKQVYKPLKLNGMEYDRFGAIVVTDRKAFIQSIAEQIDGLNLYGLERDASDKLEMKKIIEEAIKLPKETETMD